MQPRSPLRFLTSSLSLRCLALLFSKESYTPMPLYSFRYVIIHTFYYLVFHLFEITFLILQKCTVCSLPFFECIISFLHCLLSLLFNLVCLYFMFSYAWFIALHVFYMSFKLW